LMTACNTRTVAYARHVRKFSLLTQRMGTKLFETRIRRSARAVDYVDAGIDLIHYDPKGPTAMDYRAFVEELETTIKEKEAEKHG